MDFLSEYLKVIDNSLSNDYMDNWDYYRYGPERRESLKRKTVKLIKRRLDKKGFFNLHFFVSHLIIL